MAETIKDVWTKFKQDISGVNEEAKAKRKNISSEFKQDVNVSKTKMKKNGTTKNLMLLWGVVATLPLFLFGLFLLFVAGVIIWSIF